MTSKLRLFLLIFFFCYPKENAADWRNWLRRNNNSEGSSGVGEIIASEIHTNEKKSFENESSTGNYVEGITSTAESGRDITEPPSESTADAGLTTPAAEFGPTRYSGSEFDVESTTSEETKQIGTSAVHSGNATLAAEFTPTTFSGIKLDAETATTEKTRPMEANVVYSGNTTPAEDFGPTTDSSSDIIDSSTMSLEMFKYTSGLKDATVDTSTVNAGSTTSAAEFGPTRYSGSEFDVESTTSEETKQIGTSAVHLGNATLAAEFTPTTFSGIKLDAETATTEKTRPMEANVVYSGNTTPAEDFGPTTDSSSDIIDSSTMSLEMFKYISGLKDATVDTSTVNAGSTTSAAEFGPTIHSGTKFGLESTTTEETKPMKMSTVYSEDSTVARTTTYDSNEFETVTSIQGILTELNTNEMIEQQIVDAMNEFSSNCNIYKPIILSVKDFVLPPELRIDLGRAIAHFFNFRIIEVKEENEAWKTYNTMITCDSSQSVEMKVSVPSRITIIADIQIIDSSNDVIKQGKISLMLTGINILKHFVQNPINNEAKKGDPFPESEFSFAKSQVSLDIDMPYQLPIYRRLDDFFMELRPLQKFYEKQLQHKMENSGISLSTSCSNVLSVERHSSMSKNLSNLYIIPDVKFETWKGLTLSAGPILIDGLLNFDSTKFIVTKPETSLLNANYIPENKIIKQIKTKNLKGKFEWQYHGKTNVLPFSIDYIDFESIFTKRAVFGDKRGETMGTSETLATTLSYDSIITNINVQVGKVEIQPTQGQYCENENHFANFILSGYIQSMLGDLLKESIKNKFINGLLLGKCDGF